MNEEDCRKLIEGCIKTEYSIYRGIEFKDDYNITEALNRISDFCFYLGKECGRNIGREIACRILPDE